jgi:hypothetical protein
MSVIEFAEFSPVRFSMSAQPDELNAIRSRIAALERENRRMKKIAMTVVVAAVAAITMGQARQSRIIEGEKFVLKDTSGKTRAELGISGGFPSLRFVDPDGMFRAEFSSELLAFTNGQVIRSKFKDSADPSKGVDYEPIDGPMVTLSESGLTVMENVKGNGARHLFVSLDWVTNPSLILQPLSTGGRGSGIEMTSAADGPSLTIRDREGFSSVFGSSSLITPSTGETHKTSAASIVLFDKDGHKVWSAPAPH